MADREEKKRRMREAQHAELLPNFPAPRYRGMSADKPRLQRENLPANWKYEKW